MTTIKERKQLVKDLATNMRIWKTMTDEQLLGEVKKVFTVVTEASRDDCYEILVMHYVNRLL